MSHPKPIQISIPQPCSQSWDEMTPNGQGRHCTQCAKTVVDFTSWSDTALYNHFAKDTGNSCGIFLASQVNRPIAIPHQPHSQLYRLTIALGLTLLFTLPYDAQAQTPPPSTGIVSAPTTPRPFITGRVLDQANRAVENAVIQVYQGGMPKGNAMTDANGNYTVLSPTPDPGYYDVIMLCIGYDSAKILQVPVVNYDATHNVNFTVLSDTVAPVEVDKTLALQALDAITDTQGIRPNTKKMITEDQQQIIMGGMAPVTNLIVPDIPTFQRKK